jgi:uncharacterized membrane protein
MKKLERELILLTYIIKELKIKVSKSKISTVLNHPDFPSLKSLSDFFIDIRVDNIVAKIAPSQLVDVPLPAIFHLDGSTKGFVVVNKVGDSVNYFLPGLGIFEESLDRFLSNWNGIVLILSPDKLSGENNFKHSILLEQFSKVKISVQYALLGILFLLTAVKLVPNPLFLILFLTNIIGFILCVLLLKKLDGFSPDWLNKVCSAEKKSCDKVIFSSASKLFGHISLPEIGTIYFAIHISTILISQTHPLKISPNFFQLVIYFIVAPFSFLSIYYQWRIIKAWCTLCLSVVFITWIQFFIGIMYWHYLDYFDISLFPAFLLGTILPILGWLTFRSYYFRASQIPFLEKELTKFKKNTSVFNNLLLNQKKVEFEFFENDIVLGDLTAPTSLLVISNPTCDPCAIAHNLLEQWLIKFDTKVKLTIRFFGSAEDNDIKNIVAKHIIALSLSGGEFALALKDWYSKVDKTTYQDWMEKFPCIYSENVDKTFNSHLAFCITSNIEKTPTLFVDGHKLPTEYNINDLEYFLMEKNL